MNIAELCAHEWHAGFVDGLVFAVFVVLFLLACFISMLCVETWRRP